MMSFASALWISYTGCIVANMLRLEAYMTILHGMLYNRQYLMYRIPPCGTTEETPLQKTPGSDYEITVQGMSIRIEETAYYTEIHIRVHTGVYQSLHRTAECACGCEIVLSLLQCFFQPLDLQVATHWSSTGRTIFDFDKGRDNDNILVTRSELQSTLDLKFGTVLRIVQFGRPTMFLHKIAG